MGYPLYSARTGAARPKAKPWIAEISPGISKKIDIRNLISRGSIRGWG
jgi:hypothetical protein